MKNARFVIIIIKYPECQMLNMWRQLLLRLEEQRKENIEWFWLFTVIVLMNLPFLVGDACCWFNLLISIFVCNLFWFHCVKAIFGFFHSFLQGNVAILFRFCKWVFVTTWIILKCLSSFDSLSTNEWNKWSWCYSSHCDVLMERYIYRRVYVGIFGITK